MNICLTENLIRDGESAYYLRNLKSTKKTSTAYHFSERIP